MLTIKMDSTLIYKTRGYITIKMYSYEQVSKSIIHKNPNKYQ